jgi:putative transposase
VSQRVAYARELVAAGHRPAVVARVLDICRQAIYRIPKPRRQPDAAKRPPVDDVERAIVEVAEANPTDGYRMVSAWVVRRLGRAVNRKRVLRVMRERKLIQRSTPPPRRRRPGFFRVERPGQLWHLDMTAVWVAEHGWVYLNAIIDCCTREIVGFKLSLRCRAVEAIAVIERAVAEQGIRPGTLTLGTDNGSAFVAKATRLVLSGLGVAHRRGGYRDPESQAFIELVPLPQGTLRLAPRVRNPRAGPGGDHRLHPPLPPPTPQPAQLPHPVRSPPDLGTTRQEHYKTRGLNRQHPREALHCERVGWLPPSLRWGSPFLRIRRRRT